jgi:Kef-type K+ transport system membrane component KefB
VGISFATLALIVLAGLLGPLLGLPARWFVPAVAGELIAGILIGPNVLDAIHPANATVSFLSEIGFAMLMLTVGMHLPLRDRRLAGALRGGALLAALVGALAIPGGLLAAAIAGTGHSAIYAVILASGSAAVLLPAIQEAGLEGAAVMSVMAQVTIADIVTIISVPIVLQPSRVGHALLGSALVAGGVALALLLARLLSGRSLVHRLRELSERRHWALDLRVSLLVLFFLAWVATRGGTSVLIAGFGAGLTVAVLGGPERLSTQVHGVADGFFVPLYFVVLGSRLDLGGLFERPALLALAGALAAINLLIRLIAAALTRTRPAAGLAASAQLGVPAAVASLGLSEHLISAVLATAIVAAALISVLFATIGVDMLASRPDRTGAPASA